MAATFAVVQTTHIVVEPPSHQYATWALGYGTTPSGAHPANLLGVASPTIGVASATLSVLLSLAIIAALVSLISDLRQPDNAAAHRRGSDLRMAHRRMKI